EGVAAVERSRPGYVWRDSRRLLSGCFARDPSGVHCRDVPRARQTCRTDTCVPASSAARRSSPGVTHLVWFRNPVEGAAGFPAFLLPDRERHGRGSPLRATRSEELTSELQSRF